MLISPSDQIYFKRINVCAEQTRSSNGFYFYCGVGSWIRNKAHSFHVDFPMSIDFFYITNQIRTVLLHYHFLILKRKKNPVLVHQHRIDAIRIKFVMKKRSFVAKALVFELLCWKYTHKGDFLNGRFEFFQKVNKISIICCCFFFATQQTISSCKQIEI